MPDKTHEQRRRDTLIRMAVDELTAWHLMVTCDHCRVENPVMVRDLVARFGPELRLVSLVPRPRCKALTYSGAQRCKARRAIEAVFWRTLADTGAGVRRTLFKMNARSVGRTRDRPARRTMVEIK